MVDDEGKANAPETFATKPALGPKFKGLTFRMQVSPLDCTGCENCAQVCPANNKALVMKPLATQTAEEKNWDAIDIAISGLVEIPVPAEWANATTGAVPVKVEATEYFDEVIQPILAQEGDKLPVSKLDPAGVVPTGTTKYEKRGIAVEVPMWIPENCIQMCIRDRA